MYMSTGCPRAGRIGSWGKPRGCCNQIQVLSRSNKCSLLLNQLSRPGSVFSSVFSFVEDLFWASKMSQW